MVEKELTYLQRNAIRFGRDGDRCQFPHPPSIPCSGNLQVHHLIPKAVFTTWFPDANPHQPEMLITICTEAHKTIHPDWKRARDRLGWSKEMLRKLYTVPTESVLKGVPTWVTRWDNDMLDIATERTDLAMENGWKFPQTQTKHP